MKTSTKLLLSIVLLFIIASSALLLCACDDVEVVNGLCLRQLSNGEYYVESIDIDNYNLTDIVIPAMHKNRPITEIGPDALRDKNLKSITIPESIKVICRQSFYCDVETVVDIYYTGDISGWCNIKGGYADGQMRKFYFNYNLYIDNELAEEIEIPNTITRIRDFAFAGCKSLSSVTLCDTVMSIGKQAFGNCDSLKNISIPDSVKIINGKAFAECNNLQYNEYDNALYLGNVKNPYVVLMEAKSLDITSCKIHENTKVIFDGAFQWCNLMTDIIIPNSIVSIGKQAFANCNNLTGISIPDSVKIINRWAFYECKNLQYNEYDNASYLGNAENPHVVLMKAKSQDITSCKINENTKVIYPSAFMFCSSLASIGIPDSVVSIGYGAFHGCHGVTDIIIPEKVTFVGDGAFVACGLTSITIPNGVVEIGAETLKGCDALKTVSIPDSVTTIGWSAFEGCKNLTEIRFKGTIEQWEAIEKGFWNKGILTNQVICLDGTVSL